MLFLSQLLVDFHLANTCYKKCTRYVCLEKMASEIVIFYTEILTGKVVMWCFFSSETSEKTHNLTFQVKISV